MREICSPDSLLTKLLPPVKPEPGVVYVPSQFALRFEHNGRKYVFHTMLKQCVEAEVPKKASAGEGFDELIRGHFLVPEGTDECAYYNSVSALVRAYTKKTGNRGFTILPTYGCNARCIYCYEEGMKQVSMTPETVEQTIRFIIETHIGNTVKLTWFGGEPLLRPDIIDRICEGMREAGIDYYSTMITNGSLITEEIIRKMKTDWKLRNIQVSMDGAEEEYIFRKKYVNYKDYYHSVMEAISRMSEEGIRVSIRCNVDENNIDGVDRFLNDLNSGITNKEHVSMYAAPLNNVRTGEDDLSVWKKIVEFTERNASSEIRPGGLIGMRRKFRISHCMADGNGVVITPDGSLFPCEHCSPDSRFGDVWNGATEPSVRSEFCRADRTAERCRNCTFLPDCTSFSNCPIHDTHCREMRELVNLSALRAMVDRADEQESAEDGDAYC